MALGVRYRDSFYSLSGVIWRVDILQDGYGGTQPRGLDFPAGESPLEICWGETDKIAPVQGSSATLKIISDTDRQFVDLYTVESGAVRMDIYRNGKLYWSGTLDTELYEEPYSTKDGYNVTLTFSDFAPLNRLDWAGTGLMTIKDIISTCVTRAGVKTGGLNTSLISTSVYSYSNAPKLTLEEVYALQENFFDEEGEPMTVMDVMKSVLQPFALRLIQKAGMIWVYDLNGIYGQKAENVEWDSNDSVLSADKIYNNVKVTFSPYGDAEMMKGTVEEDPQLSVESSDGITIKQNYKANDYGSLSALDGFKLFYKKPGESNLESRMAIHQDARLFQIRSIYSGKDETGVIAVYKHGHSAVAEEDGASSKVKHQLMIPRDCGTINDGNASSTTIITCPKVFLGHVSYLKSNYYLRINLSLLFDVRYNPFEKEGDYNDNAKWHDGLFNWTSHDGPYQNMQDWCNFGYVPIKLSLVDADGKPLCHYENRAVLDSGGYDHTGKVKWVSGTASWGDAYLCYYDFDNRKSKTGFGGWKTNKQIIGYYRDGLPDKWKSIDDGEYVPLPSMQFSGGYLVLEIGSGIHQFDYKREVKNIYKFCRWIAYKEPSITLCKKNYKEAGTEDVEDSAWLNRAAKEDFDIDTVLGTLPQNHGTPNAKGQIFKSTGEAYSKFCRAGVQDRLERLLIGTVYSQYATRHNVLSGTVRLLPSFCVLGDEGRTAGKFLILSEVQNCREDTSEIKMSELSEDNYQGIEYDKK